MKAHRIKTTLTENGTLNLKDLPFMAGDSVEIVILERHFQPPDSNPYPRRNTGDRYDDPFEPAQPLEDWEVLQ